MKLKVGDIIEIQDDYIKDEIELELIYRKGEINQITKIDNEKNLIWLKLIKMGEKHTTCKDYINYTNSICSENYNNFCKLVNFKKL